MLNSMNKTISNQIPKFVSYSMTVCMCILYTTLSASELILFRITPDKNLLCFIPGRQYWFWDWSCTFQSQMIHPKLKYILSKSHRTELDQKLEKLQTNSGRRVRGQNGTFIPGSDSIKYWHNDDELKLIIRDYS